MTQPELRQLIFSSTNEYRHTFSSSNADDNGEALSVTEMLLTIYRLQDKELIVSANSDTIVLSLTVLEFKAAFKNLIAALNTIELEKLYLKLSLFNRFSGTVDRANFCMQEQRLFDVLNEIDLGASSCQEDGTKIYLSFAHASPIYLLATVASCQKTTDSKEFYITVTSDELPTLLFLRERIGCELSGKSFSLKHSNLQPKCLFLGTTKIRNELLKTLSKVVDKSAMC